MRIPNYRRRDSIPGVGLAYLVFLIVWLMFFTCIPADAHTNAELDDWEADWLGRAYWVQTEVVANDYNLTLALSDALSYLRVERADMYLRHQCQLAGICVIEVHHSPTVAPGGTGGGSGGGFSPGVEQWRNLVATYFPASQVEKALAVMACETVPDGNPNSYNASSGASGLFQHLPKYWASRSSLAGWGGADIFDPTANVAVAAWLLAENGWGSWTCA